jgi:hypothetical protein
MVSKEQTKAKPSMQSNQSTNNGTNHNWRKIIVSIIIGVIIGLLLIIIANFGMSIYTLFSPPKVPQNIKMTAPQASSPAIMPPPKKIAESRIKKNIPKFDLKTIAVNIPQNDVYKSQALFTIKSKTSLKNVYLTVRAKSIISFYVSSQRGGLVILGLTAKRGGYAFTNISNAHGQYILEIISKKPDNIKITYDYK